MRRRSSWRIRLNYFARQDPRLELIAMRGRWPKLIGNDGLARIQASRTLEPGAQRNECERRLHRVRTRSAPPTNRVCTRSSAKQSKRCEIELYGRSRTRDCRPCCGTGAGRSEADKAGKAIAAFASLAERLEAAGGRARQALVGGAGRQVGLGGRRGGVAHRYAIRMCSQW